MFNLSTKRVGEYYPPDQPGKRTKSRLGSRRSCGKPKAYLPGGCASPRPIEEAAGIEAVIRAIRRAELDSDDTMRVVSALKGMGLIDVAAVSNTGRGAVHFAEFVEQFWDYDNSEYIKNLI